MELFGSSLYAFVTVPLIPLAVVGLLALFLRWASPPRPDTRARRRDFGLLVPLEYAATAAEAEHVAHRLRVEGIRASTARDGGRYAVLVWKSQTEIARVIAARLHDT